MNKIITLIKLNTIIVSLFLISSVSADKITIVNKDDEEVEIEYYTPKISLIFGDSADTTYTIADIDTMLSSTDYMNRGLAASVLAGGIVADTVTCIELLINAIGGEINHPLSTQQAGVVSGTITDFLLGQYIHDLRVLLNNEDQSTIRPYILKSKGDLRKLLILVEGFLGDKQVREEVRNIYLESENGFFRFQAIHVMTNIPDIADIQVLKKALNDEYFIEDICGNKDFPIIGSARGALINLGFTIEEIEKMRSGEK